jgi:hypothetical protein
MKSVCHPERKFVCHSERKLICHPERSEGPRVSLLFFLNAIRYPLSAAFPNAALITDRCSLITARLRSKRA